MSERKKILELFDKESAFYKETILGGIEKYRKGDAKITLVDENGEKLKNVKVLAVQKTHEFKFGANLFLLDEFETEEKNKLYKERFKEVFNIATLAFYWRELEPVEGTLRYDKDSEKIYRRPSTDLCVEYCLENGIEPREHALCYDRFYPLWVKEKSTEELKGLLEKRIKEVADRYADKIPTIEVCNEMTVRNGITQYYWDPECTEWCHKTARKYFPNNILGINEGPTSCWKGPHDESNKYYKHIKEQMEKGAPIDAIGLQYHLFYKREEEYENTRLTLNPEFAYKSMSFFAQLVPNLQITEITMPAYSNDPEDEEIQADVLENMYRVWFSHPNTTQIVYWNLVDGYGWAPVPEGVDPRSAIGSMKSGENTYFGGLLRFDLSPKPAFKRLKHLLEEEWHTTENMTTNDEGEVAFRGFYGDYNITFQANDKLVTKKITLSSKAKNDFEIRL